MSRRRLLVLAVALAVRALGLVLADRTVADVLRYQRVADHVLNVSWDPYQAPRLYPYPPVWVWVEVAARWLSQRSGLSFPVLVKLPVVAADLGIVAWLGTWGPRFGTGLRSAWIYALHPVALLVTAFHGQFDAVAMLFVLLALSSFEDGHRDRSALALAAAVSLKSFPVLLLPLFLLAGTLRQRLRYAVLAVLPVGLLLVPFLIHDPHALVRELFGYGGVADFGWIGLWRGLVWLGSGPLLRSEAVHWAGAVTVAKLAFAIGYGLLLLGLASGRLAWSRAEASLAVILAFLTLYGATSAQYLLWAVPLGALFPGLPFLLYSAAATVALLGFYPFLAPGVLWPAGSLAGLSGRPAGMVWVAGVAGVLVASLVWLGRLLARTSPWPPTARSAACPRS